MSSAKTFLRVYFTTALPTDSTDLINPAFFILLFYFYLAPYLRGSLPFCAAAHLFIYFFNQTELSVSSCVCGMTANTLTLPLARWPTSGRGK